jgi:hypothetical protein
MYEHQSIYPTGSIRANFNGPDNAVSVTITDLRAATSHGTGIVVSPGRKKYTSYDDAAEAAWTTVAKMTGHTVEELKSSEFYQSR